MFLRYDYNEFPHENFKKFLTKYNITTIVCESQSYKLFNNYSNEIINITDKQKINMNVLIQCANILCKKVKYFSLSDLLKTALFNQEISEFNQNILSQLNHKCIAVNLPVKHIYSLYLNGSNQQQKSKIENTIPYVNFEEFFYLLKTQSYDNFSLLLGAKILTSSFFLSEFIDMFGYNHSFTINKNIFFQDFTQLKNFMQSIEYSDFFNTFEKQDSYEDAIIYLQNRLQIRDFSAFPKVVFRYDNNFCLNGQVFSDIENINCENFIHSTLHIKTNIPLTRHLSIPIPNNEIIFDNAYDFYMNNVLGYKKKSITSIKLKNLYNCFLYQEPINNSLIFHSDAIIKFLNKIKPQIVITNNKIYYNNIRLFFSLSSYQTKKLKIFAKNKNLFHIFIANFTNYNIEEYRLRKSNIKKLLKFSY